MSLDEPYQTVILDHYRKKHHSGLWESYEVGVHHVNSFCGDELTLRVHLDGDTIADVSYDGEGRPISQTSTSVLGDLVIGRDADHFPELYDNFLEMMYFKGETIPDEDRPEDAIAFAGVSKLLVHVRCALLAWSALRDTAAQASAKEN